MIGLVTIVSLATVFTGSPCAAIDNGPNVAVWTERVGTEYQTYSTTYRDMGGPRLQYVGRGPWGSARADLRYAEASLQLGKAGHKVRIACG